MGKKDWKAKAKALKNALKALRGSTPSAEGSAATAKAAKPVSPLAPAHFPDLPVIKGAEFAAIGAGIKYQGRKDVMLVRLAPGTTMAGAFTRSTTRSGCVRDCQTKLATRVPEGAGAAIIVNSGNSNAFTGKAGEKSVAAVTSATAKALGLPASRVFSSSTGVIGEPLPHERITAAIPTLVAGLKDDAIAMAAQAMMTTDTFPKGASATIQGEGGPIHIAGIAKGSGMIAPDMATMLAYVVTDARLSHEVLQELLSAGVKSSFNAITVDSDTSTSDTLMLFATGSGAKHPAIAKASDKKLDDFRAKLNDVLTNLALQVVRDGEGATKQIAIEVAGAETDAAARTIALSIANSPLVKTAIAGEDANWGRIVMAVGKAGEAADRDRLAISFGPYRVAHQGMRDPAYSEAKVSAYMKKSEIDIAVDIGLGKGKSKVWTCDLTDGYIRINGAYRS